MAEVSVRITRTWDVTVGAEYGDTDEVLCERAVQAVEEREQDGQPDAEDIRILPNLEAIPDQSEYDNFAEVAE